VLASRKSGELILRMLSDRWVHVHLQNLLQPRRKDSTISVMGANIYPEDVESVVYSDSVVAKVVHSYSMSLVDDDHGNPRPYGLQESSGRICRECCANHQNIWHERRSVQRRPGTYKKTICADGILEVLIMGLILTLNSHEGSNASANPGGSRQGAFDAKEIRRRLDALLIHAFRAIWHDDQTRTPIVAADNRQHGRYVRIVGAGPEHLLVV